MLHTKVFMPESGVLHNGLQKKAFGSRRRTVLNDFVKLNLRCKAVLERALISNFDEATGKSRMLEVLWLRFFSNPSGWWDNRLVKRSHGHADFQHKTTKECLWVDNFSNPPWVETKLATITNDLAKLGQNRGLEELWQLFFSDPSQWWDNRANNKNMSFPDFKHKVTRDSLWVGSQFNPPWVKSALDTTTSNESWFDKAQRTKADLLWREFFADPSQWWDHRCDKTKTSYPDFKHKKLNKALWVDKSTTSDWVKIDLAALTPGTVERSMFSWNMTIGKHLKYGENEEALELFHSMQKEGVKPDKFTFTRVLNACSSLAVINEGRHIHAQIVQSGWQMDVFVGTCLINMYSECGSIAEACRVFQNLETCNLCSWNAMVAGYVKCGESKKALELLQQMQRENMEPDCVTFLGVIGACGSLAALEDGRRLHAQAIQSGYKLDVKLHNCLIDMYGKCESIEDACRLFTNMLRCTVVSWSTMILAYMNCGQGQKALQLFHQMYREGVEPDIVTYVIILKVCASLATLEEGRRVHFQIICSGFKSEVIVGNCLVDMYSKCGSIEDARRVFENMPTRDVVSWTAMLHGFSINGLAKEAVRLFEQMCRENVNFESVAFVSLLSACDHGGLVDEGIYLFEAMHPIYGFSATLQHYVCMIDTLGRAGYLDEAEDIVKKMPFQSSACVWIALLGACRKHGSMEMGERAANKVTELDPENCSGYVLLGNLYATTGKLDG